MPTFTLGSRYVLDETFDLQQAGEDNDVTFTTLPDPFELYLASLSLSAARLQFAADIGAANSDAGVIGLSGTVTSLTLHDSTNGVLDGDNSGLLTLAGNSIFLYATDDPHIVIGREGSGGTADPAGEVVFAIYLDANAGNTSATLWSVLFEPIRHPDGGASHDEVLDLGQNLKIGAVGTLELNLATLAAGNLYFGSFGDAKDADPDAEIAVVVIARDHVEDSVNTSQGGGNITIGIANQMFDPGEAAYFTFVTGMIGTQTSQGIKLPSAGANIGPDGIVYDDLYQSTGASFTIVQIQGGGNDPRTNVHVVAYLEDAADPQGAAFASELGDDTAVKIDLASVKVFVNGVAFTDFTVIHDGVNQTGLGIILTNVPDGATVSYLTVDGLGDPANHNRVMIENIDGNPFDIGGFGLISPPVFEYIGQLIGFGDDGPTTSLSTTSATAEVDETNLNLNDTVLGSALFTQVDNFGTDGDGAAVSYSLTIANGGATGLLTAITNEAITLFQLNPTTVQGRFGAGNTVAFIVTIDSTTGDVTLNQEVAIEHSNPNDPNDTRSIVAGSLLAVRQITDGDTDTISDNADIGPNMVFVDDAPTTDLTLEAGVKVTVDETNLAGDTTVSGALLFNWTDTFGNDGAGTGPAFTLSIGGGGGTGLTTSTTNEAITLFQLDSTTVQGRFGAGNTVAFVVTIDPANSDVTLNQIVPIEHPTSDPDEALSILAGRLFAVRGITDGDGDPASGNADIGPRLEFKDDGPTANLVLQANARVMVDETLLDSDTTVAGNLLFTPSSNVGADNFGTSSAYTLDVVGGGSALTALTTSDGQPITLFETVNTAVVEGRYGPGLIAFVVTIDGASGAVTLDQRVALDHPDGTNPDDSLFLGAGLLNAVLTVTDGDGDSASGSADIGPALEFQDDGPTAAITSTGNAAITDESTTPPASDGGLAEPGDDDGKVVTLSATATDLIGWATATVVDASGGSFGNDGAGTKLVTLMVASAGVYSGLDTTAGLAINLYKVGATVFGRSAPDGDDVFAIAIDQNGVVTVEQYGSIDHLPNAGADQLKSLAVGVLFAKVLVTDQDDDIAPAKVDIGGQIGFEDDGPDVTLTLKPNVTILVDESVGVDLGDFNAADEAATLDPTDIGYAALAGAALFDTTLDIGEDDEGATTAYSLNVDIAQTALLVSNVEGAGAVVTLVEVDDQTVEGRYNGGLVAFRMTIAAGTGNVTFTQFAAVVHNDDTNTDEQLALGSGLISAIRTVTDGDGDSDSASVDIGSLVQIEDDAPIFDTVLDPPEDLLLDNLVGDTASGSVGSDGGRDLSADFSFLNPDSTGDFTWEYFDVDGSGTAGQHEIRGSYLNNPLYTLIANPDGTYDFTMIGALPDGSLRLSTAEIKAGAPDTNSIEVGAIDSTDFVRISGSSTIGDGFINESNAFVGVDNGNLDIGETLVLALYADIDPNTVGDGTIIPVGGFNIGTKSAKRSEYHIVLKDEAGNIITEYNQMVLKNGVIRAIDPGGALFATVEITKLSGPATKIGVGNIEILRPPPDVELQFDLRLTDRDNDFVDTGFTVSIDGNGDGQIIAPIGSLVAPLTSSQAVIEFLQIESLFVPPSSGAHGPATESPALSRLVSLVVLPDEGLAVTPWDHRNDAFGENYWML